MGTSLWSALGELSTRDQMFFLFALAVAFGFEFINGFHDTANAVTTVIYTKTLRPTPAVLFSGFCNFLGVLVGGTTVAFGIVHLLPVDLLIESETAKAVVMVLSLLLAGLIWNLGTWWYGLPVSSSHTLIGSILGVGLANSLLSYGDTSGVNWPKAAEVGLSLLISPLIGFVSAAGLLWAIRRLAPNPRLHQPPVEGEEPPRWVRGVLLTTCGGVSLAHGSNDGQKGMGLILLVLIGFLPAVYAVDLRRPEAAREVRAATLEAREVLAPLDGAAADSLREELAAIDSALGEAETLAAVPASDRWRIRRSIYRFDRDLATAGLPSPTLARLATPTRALERSIEYVPTWVVVGVALALGVGTTIGYKRIVVTVAEKIGKAHLTYAQGAAAEVVAAFTIGLADAAHLPVSTTHVLSSGVAGTMVANRSGVRGETVRRIGLAWVLTLPAAILLSSLFFAAGSLAVGEPVKAAEVSPAAVVSE